MQKVSEVTQEQKQEWKDKHGVVREINVVKKDGKKIPFIIGKPTRPILDAYSKYSEDNNQTKAREVMQNSCVLAGDIDVLNDPKEVDVQNSVFTSISDLFDKLTVEVKEL